MARWCIKTGQTPATWRELTRTERDAFENVVDEYIKTLKRK